MHKYIIGLLSFLVATTLFIFPVSAQQINWSDPIDVSSSSFGNDYPRMVLDGDQNPLITWGSSDKVYFSRFENGDFSAPIMLNDESTNAYTASWTGPDLVARNDTVYACFMHRDWTKKTFLIRSFDNGETFSSPIEIENYQDSTSRFPTVAIDQNGNPLVGIMKMDLNGHHPNYVVRKSTDHGASFTSEANAGGWSGPDSEACDCCPASITSSGQNTALFYRNNFGNLRDIYASISNNAGSTFDSGFAVDNSNWEIFACPASGPDGVIIGDTLYSVFLSGLKCYLSKSSISNESLYSVSPLGEIPSVESQNFPRISNYGNSVAISWMGSLSGTKLFVSYTDDITNGMALRRDTVYSASFSSADVVLGENGIHIVIEALGGSVKYLHGTIRPTSISKIDPDILSIYPNPSNNRIHIDGHENFKKYILYSINGQVLEKGNMLQSIDLSKHGKGSFVLELIDNEEQTHQKVIIRK